MAELPKPVLTQKQATFARAFLETGNASEAYRRAYNAGNMTNAVIANRASELLKHGEVAGMVAELRAQHRKRHDLTVDRLTEMAIAAYNLAMQPVVAAPAAAISAVLAIGKLHGLIVDKKEVTRKSNGAELTDAELLEIVQMNTSTTPKNGWAQ
jgi:phage terminase small subunit